MSNTPPSQTDIAAWVPSRRRLLVSAMCLTGGSSLLTLAGCGGGSSSDEAYLRFVNATVDDATADFYVNGSKAISKLANGGAVTNWASLEPDATQIALYSGGGTSAQLTVTRTLDKDSYTSVLAHGSLATSLQYRFIVESNAKAASGQIKVRLCHAAENLGGLDLYISNESSLSGLSPVATVTSYGDLSDFGVMASGQYRIRLTARNNPSNVLFDYTDKVNLSTITVHTLVVVPRSSGSYPNISALQEQGDSALLGNMLV